MLKKGGEEKCSSSRGIKTKRPSEYKDDVVLDLDYTKFRKLLKMDVPTYITKGWSTLVLNMLINTILSLSYSLKRLDRP